MIIWGDDIGFWNISAYNTGRAAFITGQSIFRTGLSKVGMPGADAGIRPEDPTIAELLKPLGYATVNFSATCITGKEKKSPRIEFFYFSDDGDLLSMCYDNWKCIFMEQRVQGTFQIWLEPFVKLRAVKIFNLHTDPFERADITVNSYFDWMRERAFMAIPVRELYYRPGTGKAAGGRQGLISHYSWR